jgi:hypothetical protein
MGGSRFESSPAKKFMTLHLNRKTLVVVVCACHPSYSRKYNIEQWWPRLAWAKSNTPSLK